MKGASIGRLSFFTSQPLRTAIYLPIEVRNPAVLFQLIVALCNASFVALYVLLCFHNRIAVDDLYFLSLNKAHGPLEATIVEHGTWSSRWASVLLVQLVLSAIDRIPALFIYGIFALALFTFAIYRSLGKLEMITGTIFNKDHYRLNISILIVSALFHGSSGIGETWFWLCSSATYLIGTIMFVIGFSTLIAPRNGPWEWLLCMIAFLYVGGSCEPLALFTLLVLSILIMRSLFRSRPISRSLLAFTTCAIAFAVLFMGEGNRIRSSFFPSIGVVESLWLNAKMTALIIFQASQRILPVLFLFALAFAAIPWKFGMKRSTAARTIAGLPVLLIVVIFLYQWPVTYVTHDVSAYRTLFPITLFALLAIVAVFSLLKQAFAINERSIRLIGIAAAFGILIFNAIIFSDQAAILPAYAEAYDRRIEYLHRMKNVEEIIEVDPLPGSGLLFSAEISDHPGHFSNRHLVAGLGLKGGVRRADR